jgi:hypothetical protein
MERGVFAEQLPDQPEGRVGTLTDGDERKLSRLALQPCRARNPGPKI